VTYRALILLLLISGLALGQAPRVNVVLILADDLGTLDLNSYGSEDLYTPNLDALAERGVSLTQHYVAAPVCSPSRGALLTGRYPYRNGVISNSRSLYKGEITIAEMLKPAGYRTALIGKWHLGEKTPPSGEGFDYTLFHFRGCIDNFSHFNYGKAPWGAPPHRHDLFRNNREIWESGTHFGDLIVREAIQFIEANAEDPFFLFLPFNTPHYPIQPYDRHRARYAGIEEPRRSYAALVSTLDEQVGVVLDTLKDVGVDERTLVIFLSDHGHSTEARTNYGGGNPGPYRGAKFSLFEGGLRVPAIASLPGVIPANQKRDQMTISCDWYPTIAAATGVDLPGRDLDGRNLLPVLQSANAATPHDILHWQIGNPEQKNPQWAIREANWKLVVNANDTKHGSKVSGEERIFLSDMEVDVTERNNLAAKHPTVVKRLTELHDRWLAKVLAENRSR
jgi:arylsulfatase A